MSRHGDDDNGDLNDIALTEGSEPLSAPTDDCITLPSLRQAQPPRESDAPPSPSRRSPILPDDLIVEILLRLPVKFLMQFRCVSKSWKSLISDPQFVKKHLRMANASLSHHRLVMSTVSVFKLHSDFNVDRLLTCSAQSFLSDPSNSVDFSLEKKTKTKTKFRIQGSCNGLLCFVYYFEKTWRVSVWNPSNRWESKKSPRLVFRRKSRPDVLFGFGYDHLTDNYKVVAVSWYLLSKTAVKVYTLGTNSWRKIEGFPYPPQQPDGWGNFLCGTLNWLVFCSNVLDGWGCEPRDRLVMSFDLGKETFREVLLPDHDDQDYSFPNIGILRDFLCYYYLYRKYSFVLWKMKEYGVKESWNKLVRIPLQDVGIDCRIWHPRPLFMSENGEVLMDICGPFLYNPQDNSIKYLEFNEDKMFLDLRVYLRAWFHPVPKLGSSNCIALLQIQMEPGKQTRKLQVLVSL